MVALARLSKYYTPQRLRHSFYAALGVYSLVLMLTHEQIDFQVCYTTGVRLLGGEALYRLSDDGMPFKYAPSVALLLGPLGLLPTVAAGVVWNSLHAVAVGYFCVAILGGACFGLGREVVGAARFLVLMQYRSFGLGALLGMTTLLLGLTWGAQRLTPDGHTESAPFPPSFPPPLKAGNA